MTETFSQNWSETVHRLAVGFEPRDAATGRRVRSGLELRAETAGSPLRAWRRFEPDDNLTPALPQVAKHPSNRFSITMAATDRLFPEKTAIAFRLVDPSRWYVPRRFVVQLADHAAIVAQDLDPTTRSSPAANRVLRPSLHPGSAYPRSPRATGLIGRVLRGTKPLRWARIRVVDRRNGRLLAVAHGDDRGEFTVLLGASITGALPDRAIAVRVIVFGPEEAPKPTDPDAPALDRLWDAPIERLPVPAHGLHPEVEAGTALPAGYTESTTGPTDLDLALGVLRSHDVPDFEFTAP